MKKIKEHINIYVAVFILCFIIAGILKVFGGNNKPNNLGSSNYTGELNIILNKEEQLLFEYTDEFNSKYPDLEINFTILSDYENELYEYMKNNEYGDVLLIPNFIDYTELDKYFIPLGRVDKLSKIYNFANTKSINNTVYGLPANANANGMVYNKKVFKEAGITELPKTIDEFMEALYLIKDNTDAIPFYTNYNEGWTLAEWEDFCYGAMTGDSSYKADKFVNEKNQFLYGTPHYKVYKLLYDIVKNDLCEDNPLNSDWETSKKLMNEGKIGCMALDSWAINQIKKSRLNSEDIGYMAFPNNINGIQSITVNSDYCYGININSKNKEAARAWIDFIINETGYVLDNDNISIVKSDPLPKSLSYLNDCQLIIENPILHENYERYLELSKDLNLQDGKEQQRIIDSALGITDESFDDIVKDWNKRWESNRTKPMENYSKEIDVEFFTIEEAGKELTAEEEAYIKKADVLIVGYLVGDYPIQYKSSASGKFSGISADVFEIIEKNTGLKFKYVPFNSESEGIEMLKNGKIDMIAALKTPNNYSSTDADNTAKFEGITLSNNYFNFNNVVIKNRKIDTDNMEEYNAAVERGRISYYELNPDRLFYYDTFEDCLKSVNNGESDYTYGNFYSTSYYTRIGDYNNIVIVPLDKDQTDVNIAFSKYRDKKILSIINKSISNISKEEMQKIVYNNTEKYGHRISISEFIQSNLLLCTIILMIVNIIIISIIGYIIVSKIRYSRKITLANKKYEQLSDLSDEYIFEFDYKKNILYFSVKFQEYFKYPKSINLNLYDGKDEHINEFISIFEKMKSDSCEEMNALYSVADGRKEWFKAVYSTISDVNNVSLNIIGKLINVDKEMSERKILMDKAFNDQLTRLYNRTGFKKMIVEYLESNKTKPIALFIFDMDGFKKVNDTFGHKEGDNILIILSENLKQVFGENNVGRWGGDEFLGCITENVTLDEVKKKAELICELMNMEIGTEDKINISLSVGICYSNGYIDFEEAFEKADKALYEVKKNGKNNFNIVMHN